jgi:hypothetical protein
MRIFLQLTKFANFGEAMPAKLPAAHGYHKQNQ